MINPFLQSLSRRNKFLAACCSSFFRSSMFSALSRREAPSKSSQGFTLCFQLLFLFIILLLPEFFMEALHDGSSRIYISSWSVHRDSFLRNSSILHLAIRSAILSSVSLEMVLCHYWSFEFMFLDSHVVMNEIFQIHQSRHWSYLGLYFTLSLP